MPLLNTEGIILQQRPFSESSKILVVFTKEYGKVSLLFKGGRKGSKKFPGGLETLNRVEVQYYQRGGRELQNFKSFDLIASYPQLRSDLRRTYTGLSIAEVILRTTAEDDPIPVLFDTAAEALKSLDDDDRNPWDIRWKCLLNISRDLGFGIQVDECSLCGAKIDIVGFHLSNGGFICKKHPFNADQMIKISPEVWGILRFLHSCPWEAAIRIQVNPYSGRQIEALFLQYYLYQVPGLKAFASWKKLADIYWEAVK